MPQLGVIKCDSNKYLPVNVTREYRRHYRNQHGQSKCEEDDRMTGVDRSEIELDIGEDGKPVDCYAGFLDESWEMETPR